MKLDTRWCNFFGGPADGAKLKIGDSLELVRVLFSKEDLRINYWDETQDNAKRVTLKAADSKRYSVHLYQRMKMRGDCFLHAGTMIRGVLAVSLKMSEDS